MRNALFDATAFNVGQRRWLGVARAFDFTRRQRDRANGLRTQTGTVAVFGRYRNLVHGVGRQMSDDYVPVGGLNLENGERFRKYGGLPVSVLPF